MVSSLGCDNLQFAICSLKRAGVRRCCNHHLDQLEQVREVDASALHQLLPHIQLLWAPNRIFSNLVFVQLKLFNFNFMNNFLYLERSNSTESAKLTAFIFFNLVSQIKSTKIAWIRLEMDSWWLNKCDYMFTSSPPWHHYFPATTVGWWQARPLRILPGSPLVSSWWYWDGEGKPVGR